MTDNDFASSGSDSPVVTATTPILDSVIELKTKSHHDCSTSRVTLNESAALHVSPLSCHHDPCGSHGCAGFWVV